MQENTGRVNFAKYGTFKILKAPPLQAVVVPRLTTKCLHSYEKLIKTRHYSNKCLARRESGVMWELHWSINL